MVDTEAPKVDPELTQEENQKRFALYYARKDKRPHEGSRKSSWVYKYYNEAEVVPGRQYRNKKGQLVNEMKWTCRLCHPSKPHTIYESRREGVTSGQISHLWASHKYNAERHRLGVEGLSESLVRGSQSTLSWGMKEKLSPEEAMRQYIVVHRQPFMTVASPEWQAMFTSQGARSPYSNPQTLRKHIMKDFQSRRALLNLELQYCTTISLSVDIWTSPNRKPIFAVIGHWVTNDFIERQEVLEFIELKGEHTGENMAVVVQDLLKELGIEQKLLAITGDNAGNNGTLCHALYKGLSESYSDDPLANSSIRPRMRFHGRKSFIRCLAHVTNLICDDILKELKSSTAREAKALLDDLDKRRVKNIPLLPGRGVLAKIRLINIWILRSTLRGQAWDALSPRAAAREPKYDCGTRWNGGYDMADMACDLRDEYTLICQQQPAIRALLPTEAEWVILAQIRLVLEPFKALTLKVSQEMPSLQNSLGLYWQIEALLDQVDKREGIFSDLHESVRNAVKAGVKKNNKYKKEMGSCIMIYVAHMLDPRVKATYVQVQMPDEADAIITSVKNYLKHEYPAIQPRPIRAVSDNVFTAEPAKPKGMSDLDWKIKKQVMAISAHIPVVSNNTSEIDRYFDSPVEAWPENCEDSWLLNWWRSQTFAFPTLSQAARELLPVPSAEVDCERLFSGNRDTIGVRRHSLKSETIRVLELLRSSYQAERLENLSTIDWDKHIQSIILKPDLFDIDGETAAAEAAAAEPAE